MTDAQAARQAKKRWGDKYGIRNSGHFSSPERRTEALEVVTKERARIKEIDDEITRRLKELDWYQAFMKERAECRQRISKTEGNAHHYRFTVGKVGTMFFEVLGQGDTWEEAFAAADAKR